MEKVSYFFVYYIPNLFEPRRYFNFAVILATRDVVYMRAWESPGLLEYFHPKNLADLANAAWHRVEAKCAPLAPRTGHDILADCLPNYPTNLMFGGLHAHDVADVDEFLRSLVPSDGTGLMSVAYKLDPGND